MSTPNTRHPRLRDRWYLVGVWIIFAAALVSGNAISTIIENATTVAPVRSNFHTYYHDNFSIASANLILNKSEYKVRDAVYPNQVREMDWNVLTTPDGVRRVTRNQKDAEANMTDRCRGFTIGDDIKQEFYSPNYPNDYGNHTDCVKIIEAPQGSLLRLDFRDEFHIEPSEDCKNDYLEVRDGAHGYSNRIGHFCGHDFPPMLTSSDRYLWLRFASDETIQYSGFRAVYTFVAKPTTSDQIPDMDLCQFQTGGNEGFANRTDIEEERDRIAKTYGFPLDCMWVIEVAKGWKVMVQFLTFKLHRPNDCDSNFVDVFSDSTDLPSREKNFCGSIADLVVSKNNILFIRFFADHRSLSSTFSAHYTAFREKPRDKGCLEDEYDCEDATCISIDLKCNRLNNCRYRWDEMDCEEEEGTLATIAKSEHIIIILVVFCLILFGMCFAFVFNCTRKLIHDHRIIQEHIRQSREGELNSIGAKGSQIVLQKVHVQERAQSHSNSSSALGVADDVRRDVSVGSMPAECYVPGGELVPIFDPNRSDEEPLPEMRDTECQTRESLFATHPIDHISDHSVSPPPPPLPAARIPKSPPNFSTFGYPKPEEKKFRAEAVIEMKDGQTRPFSIQSTKSAPDVIVTH